MNPRLPLLLAALLATTPAVAADWRMDPAASSLTFSGSQGGARFDGGFRTFSAEIHFDPAALDRTKIAVRIATGSAFAGARDRDQALPGADWFNVAAFPEARFTAKRVELIAGTRYRLIADLAIRDRTVEVEMPVEIAIDGNRATATGELTVERTRFGVGQGSWASGSMVAIPVTIRFALTATR